MRFKKILVRLIIFISFSVLLLFGFIYYAASDPITIDNIDSKNQLYMSLRYRILTDLYRIDNPNYIGEDIPEFDFSFSQNDIEHIYALQEFTQADAINFEEYKELNKWCKGDLNYNGKKYSIKWKSHGKEPDFHNAGEGFLSLNVKLTGGQLINDVDHFRLIIYKRLSADVKVIEYLADNFDLITRKHDLVNVNIGDIGSSQYWFEDRYNDVYSVKNNRPSQVIFSKGNEKSHVISNDSNVHSLQKSLRKLLNKKEFNDPISDSIKLYFKNFNNNLLKGNSDSILNFVDEEYISSFFAARMIGNCNFHGLRKDNLFIYFDTIDFKFYPCLSRDHFIAKIGRSDSIEYYMDNYYPGENKTKGSSYSYFSSTLLNNDVLRQKVYDKVFQFINLKEKEFTRDICNIYDAFEHRHFPSWIVSVQGLTHLHTLPLMHTNADSLVKYLSSSRPVFSIIPNSDKIEINFEANSMTGLAIEKLQLQGVESDKLYLLKLKDIHSSLMLAEGNFQSSGEGVLNITDLVDGQLFYNKLNASLAPQKSQYIIEVTDSLHSNLTTIEPKLNCDLVNTVTSDKYAINL